MRGSPSDKVCVLSSLMQGHQQRAEDESRGGSENGVVMLSAHEKFAVMISSEKAQLRIFLQSVQFAPAQTQRRHIVTPFSIRKRSESEPASHLILVQIIFECTVYFSPFLSHHDPLQTALEMPG